jgi:hypothetical protein
MGTHDGVTYFFFFGGDQDEAYSITVIEPLARYCATFPDVNEAIKRRQKKLLDYESHRLKVRKLVEKPSDDPQRLPMVSPSSLSRPHSANFLFNQGREGGGSSSRYV